MGLRNHSSTLQPQFSSRDRVRAFFVHGVPVGVPKDELLWVPGKLQKELEKLHQKHEYFDLPHSHLHNYANYAFLMVATCHFIYIEVSNLEFQLLNIVLSSNIFFVKSQKNDCLFLNGPQKVLIQNNSVKAIYGSISNQKYFGVVI